MNEIQRLIHEMCPDGVPMVALGEVCEIRGRIGFRGYTRADQVTEGEGALSLSPGNISNGVMDYSKGTYITWKKYEESPEIITENGDIIFCKTASCGKVAIVKNLPYKATINPQLVVLKNVSCSIPYLYYVLSSNSIQECVKKLQGVGSVPNISQAALSSFQIPLPPLPIQQRIVKILDKFTSLVSSLDSEIALRQKQYEYYRNKLLSFEEEDTEYIKLGKLCQIRNGYTPSKTNLEYWTNGTIPWFRLEDIRQNGRILSDAIQHITEIAVKKGGPFKENSVIVSTTATIGEHAIITVPFVCNQQITILTPFEDSVLPKYLYYCGYLIGQWCKNNVNGAGLAIIPSNKLTECEIPVPSLDKQQRIVRTLDTFESLLTNLKKERELRQKQYEYYREKLLTFA